MLELDHRYDHRGQSIAWGVMGAGDPIILVHGFPWSAQAWRRIAPWLARSHRVFFFDMLGHKVDHFTLNTVSGVLVRLLD